MSRMLPYHHLMASSGARRTRGRKSGSVDLPRSEQSLLVDLARLVYERKMTQKEAADELSLSDSTASRLMERAHSAGVVKVFINPPRLQRLEEDLLREVRRLQTGSALSQIVVVPGGTGKNEQNLGAGGAKLLYDRIVQSTRKRTRVTFSCGRTVQAVCAHFATLVERAETLRGKTLELYPATLYADYQVDPIYPATLVTSLAATLRGSMENQSRGGLAVEAYTTSLPRGFYKRPARECRRFLEKYGIRKLIDDAQQADVFVVGMGRVDDSSYLRLLSQFDVDSGQIAKRYRAEMVYVPFREDGSECREMSEKIAGISLSELRRITAQEGRWVIAVAGGESKSKIVRLALRNPCFNVLVTDETAAREILEDPLS